MSWVPAAADVNSWYSTLDAAAEVDCRMRCMQVTTARLNSHRWTTTHGQRATTTHNDNDVLLNGNMTGTQFTPLRRKFLNIGANDGVITDLY